jgi:hypothetical protein
LYVRLAGPAAAVAAAASTVTLATKRSFSRDTIAAAFCKNPANYISFVTT